MRLELRRLPTVDLRDLVDLFNHEEVRRHLPLATGEFTEERCRRWVAGKERLWEEAGYGPWAFYAEGAFAGWRGLQPEEGEADLGLVLHPDHWGIGPAVCRLVVADGFDRMGFPSVIALLPPTRTRVRALERFGFLRDGEMEVGGERFVRYRLTRERWGREGAQPRAG